MILFLWSSMAPKPIIVKDQIKESQTIDSKEDIDKNIIQPLALPATETIPSAIPKNEKIEELKNKKITVEFSNIGGNIKKILINEYKESFPVRNIQGLNGYDELEFSSEIINNNEINYIYEDNNVQIIKSYKIIFNEYIIESNIKLKNKSNLSNLGNISQEAMILDMSNLNVDVKQQSISNDTSLFEYAINTEKGIERKAKAFKFVSKENKADLSKVNWVGFRDRFFCVIVVPQYQTSGYSVEYINEKTLKIGLNVPANNLNEISYSSLIFAGPEITDLLKQYNLSEIKRYYKSGFFDAVAKAIDYTMNMIHKLIPNWGISIILISLVIYFEIGRAHV